MGPPIVIGGGNLFALRATDPDVMLQWGRRS